MKKLFSVIMAAVLLAGLLAVAAAADDFEALAFDAQEIAEEPVEADFAELLAQLDSGAADVDALFDEVFAVLEAQAMTEIQVNAFNKAKAKLIVALDELLEKDPVKLERLKFKFLYQYSRRWNSEEITTAQRYLYVFSFFSYELPIFFDWNVWQGLAENGFMGMLYATWATRKYMGGLFVRYVLFGWLWMGG